MTCQERHRKVPLLLFPALAKSGKSEYTISDII